MKHTHTNNIKFREQPLIDKVVYIAAIGYPFMALPQVLKIYSTHSAHDLAISSWILYAVFEFIFLIYGVSKRLKPLVITGLLWLVVYAFVIIGVILYG